MTSQSTDITVQATCRRVGISRQAFYQGCKRRNAHRKACQQVLQSTGYPSAHGRAKALPPPETEAKG